MTMAASREEPNEHAGCDACSAGPMRPIEDETARGLRFAHIMIAAIEQQNCETRAAAQLLAQLLISQGLISEEEWSIELERARGIDIPSA